MTAARMIAAFYPNRGRFVTRSSRFCRPKDCYLAKKDMLSGCHNRRVDSWSEFSSTFFEATGASRTTGWVSCRGLTRIPLLLVPRIPGFDVRRHGYDIVTQVLEHNRRLRICDPFGLRF